MALFDGDDDRNEFATELNKLLGIEEGKKLADVIAEAIQPGLNAVDKRGKEAIATAIAALPKPPEGGIPSEMLEGLTKLLNPEPGDPAAEDLSKLPQWAQTMIGKQNEAMATLTTQVESEKTAREAADQLRQEGENDGMRRYMANATQEAATTAGLDSTKMKFFMPYAAQEQLVRGIDGKDGHFEMKSGVDPMGDPVYKPLEAGMVDFAKSEEGKNFRPVRAGTSPETPTDPGKPPIEGEMVPFSSMKDNPKLMRETPPELIDLNA